MAGDRRVAIRRPSGLTAQCGEASQNISNWLITSSRQIGVLVASSHLKVGEKCILDFWTVGNDERRELDKASRDVSNWPQEWIARVGDGQTSNPIIDSSIELQFRGDTCVVRVWQ